jgi:glycosyltransferase involved in cell wall biosynthesis
LISNFNYAQFVGEALNSALQQTVPFNEIIVVDDGSTDGSLELLRRNFGSNPKVHIFAKENAGQLSCFNHGVGLATGDIVFFLDADDEYEPHDVVKALETYRHHPTCDFLFCGRRFFGQQNSVLLNYPTDRDFGYSVLRTSIAREWIGAATSCLSIRRNILNKFLPLPFADEWRVRADDCLVFGASLAGARKRFLAQPLVRYRVHGENGYRGRTVDSATTYRRRLAINQLFEYLERNLHLNMVRLAEFHHREYCTIDSPTLGQLGRYARIGLSAHISPLRHLGCIAEMMRHYVVTKLRNRNLKKSGVAASTKQPAILLDRAAATPVAIARSAA